MTNNAITGPMVRQIFQLNANGMTQPDIPAVIEKEFGVEVTEHQVREILHQRGQFPRIAEACSVPPETVAAVQRRFRSGSKRRRKPKTEPSAPNNVLLQALEARMAWDKAREAVFDQTGLSDDVMIEVVDDTVVESAFDEAVAMIRTAVGKLRITFPSRT